MRSHGGYALHVREQWTQMVWLLLLPFLEDGDFCRTFPPLTKPSGQVDILFWDLPAKAKAFSTTQINKQLDIFIKKIKRLENSDVDSTWTLNHIRLIYNGIL